MSMNRNELNLVVVIVCYRSADLAIDALASLEREIPTVPDSRVIVCENGTGPESTQLIREAIEANGWGDWVSLVEINPNRGFAGGNNAVLRDLLEWKTPPRYVMLLNSDTIVRPGALRSLYDAAESHPEAGVIGPRLEWPDGTAQISCFRHQSPVTEFLAAARTGIITRMFGNHEVPIAVTDSPIEPPWLSFACAIIRRETLQQVGVLDDGYYLYFDDVDYGRRAWNAGWHVLYWPDAHVVHLRGRSNPVKEMTAQRKRRPKYLYFSRSRYFAKFYGRFGLWLTNLCWLAGRSISLIRELLWLKQPHTCAREGIDIWTNAWNPMTTDRIPKQSDEPKSRSDSSPAATNSSERHAAA
jgi:hypothetical protein